VLKPDGAIACISGVWPLWRTGHFSMRQDFCRRTGYYTFRADIRGPYTRRPFATPDTAGKLACGSPGFRREVHLLMPMRHRKIRPIMLRNWFDLLEKGGLKLALDKTSTLPI